MRYKSETSFPEKIDSLLYYSDASYENKKTIDNFNEEWQNGNINEANEIVKNDEKLHYSSADLLNRLEFQYRATQEYLLNKTKNENPMVYGEEPNDPEVHFIWVEDR